MACVPQAERIRARTIMDTPIAQGKLCPLQILTGSCVHPYYISDTYKERHLHHCTGFKGSRLSATACSVTT